MSKTIALRTVVESILNGLVTPAPTEQTPNPVPAEKVYYQQAEKGAQKYIVFSLDEILREDERTTIELEINVMDYGNSTTAAETLADLIQKTFDKKVVINNDIGVYFYIDRRNNPTEEDRLVIRRRLTFTTYLYER